MFILYINPCPIVTLSSLVSRIKDKSEDGKVSYIEFFTRLGVTIKPGDLEGLSTQITKGSEEAEQLRNSDLVNR